MLSHGWSNGWNDRSDALTRDSADVERVRDLRKRLLETDDRDEMEALRNELDELYQVGVISTLPEWISFDK